MVVIGAIGVPALLELSSHVKLLVVYPLLPWPAMMAAGYLMGPLYKRTPECWHLLLFSTGAAPLWASSYRFHPPHLKIR